MSQVEIQSKPAVAPSDCAGDKADGPLVFATGMLGFDPGTYPRRDTWNAHSNAELFLYLRSTPSDAELVIWTLSIDERPVYAIKPAGPFARAMYQKLIAFLQVSFWDRTTTVAGRITGAVTLLNGEVIPVLSPEPAWLSPEPMWLGPLSKVLSTRYDPVCVSNVTQPQSFDPVVLTQPDSLDWVVWNGDEKTRQLRPSVLNRGELDVDAIGTSDAPAPTMSWDQLNWSDGNPDLAGSSSKGGVLSVKQVLNATADLTKRTLRIYVHAVGVKVAVTFRIMRRIWMGGPAGTPGAYQTDRIVNTPTTQMLIPWGGTHSPYGVFEAEYQGSVSAMMDTPDVLEAQVVVIKGTPEELAAQGNQNDKTQLARIFAATLSGSPLRADEVVRPVALQRFVDRLRAVQRNLGMSPSERAMNFAVAQAATESGPLSVMHSRGMVLDDITVERNAHCRPRADCWDVRFVFFNPNRVMDVARAVHCMTVDVSQVRPVLVGRAQTWNEM